MQETILGELIFAPIHAGPVFALARIQEKMFEELFSTYLPNSKNLGGELVSVRVHAAPVFAPARIRHENIPWRIMYALVSCQGGHS